MRSYCLKTNDKPVHFLGLLSDGRCFIAHYISPKSLIDASGKLWFEEKLIIHAFTDGRDVDLKKWYLAM